MVPICLIFVPGPSASRGVQKSLLWRRKLWELNTGLMGLCLAVASAFFFTQGMKNLFGKPRPDLLSRCKPNLANLATNAVGGFGNDVPLWNELQSWTICTQTNKAILNDGFQSFPSGHSSCEYHQRVTKSIQLTYVQSPSLVLHSSPSSSAPSSLLTSPTSSHTRTQAEVPCPQPSPASKPRAGTHIPHFATKPQLHRSTCSLYH